MINLSIELLKGNICVVKSNDITFIGNPNSTVNKFIFVKADIQSEVEINDKLHLYVYIKNKKGEKQVYRSLEILVLDYDYTSNDFSLEVLITNCFDQIYEQGVVNVFKFWDLNLEARLAFKNEKFSSENYITACMLWGGVQKIELKPKNIVIDLSVVTSIHDLFYLLGKEIVGFKGYIGYDLHTFEDCLISLNNKESVSVKFINDRISDPYLLDVFKWVRKILIEHGFNISVDSYTVK